MKPLKVCQKTLIRRCTRIKKNIIKGQAKNAARDRGDSG